MSVDRGAQATAVGAQYVARLLQVDAANPSLVDRIAIDVALAIVDGRIAPGDKVDSVSVARRYHSSRTPAREAMLLLERHGLVTTVPRRRPRVTIVPAETMMQIYDVRAVLSALVSRLVCTNATDEDLEELRLLLDAMGEAAASGSESAYFWANVAYNERSAEISRNPVLAQTLDSLGLRVLRLRRLTFSIEGQVERSLASHRRIQDAFEARDADLAAALTSSVIRSAKEALAADYDRHARKLAERGPSLLEDRDAELDDGETETRSSESTPV
ncbi:GntR family transcriptional regulator [Microbacterium sp.]|uniref:GntR family transcriptional regulator n=1 Tax=Microbacterium sp. TaxID=51671 RepID=UPI002C8428EB|nr:GntR family transcriptional regulator [Microbacterium sp.]HWL76526.1 GntR family transcriptional regulator [Microbacterium sp.]